MSLRSDMVDALDRTFDLLVIGGGVNGLGIAWDAAERGWSVLLIDKGDWGSGTSSWSSRMIHGGFKYLEKLELRLVRESLREREWLLRRAPHLVRPLPFVVPYYRRNAYPRFALELGMLAYDILSWDKSVPHHRGFSAQETLLRMPGLDHDGLKGSGQYYDAQVAYAERMSIEIALAARRAGAVTLNHLESTGLLVEDGRVIGAQLRDLATRTDLQVRARFTVNVAGPWVDHVLTGSDAAAMPLIGGTKGTHLVVKPFPGAPREALYYEADLDGRRMMVIPWLGNYLIGSTDKRFSGDLDTASADQEEIDYILSETNKIFPRAGLTAANALYSYTGVRPLPRQVEGKEGDITRRHLLHDHRPHVDGLISVIGGKLTTFRSLAQHATDVIAKRIGLPGRSRTRRLDLPGKPPLPVPEYSDDFRHRSGFPPEVADRLVSIYGGRSDLLLKLIRTEPTLAEVIDPVSGLLAAEVALAVREEQAVTLADLLCRRTMVGLNGDLGRSAIEPALRAMADESGWDRSEVDRQRDDYLTYLQRFLSVEASGGQLPTRG